MILVGHSLGGILAAEVALLPSHIPGSVDYFQHRILGVMAFDTPFLGVHPSVIKTGLASLFKSGVEPPKITSSELSPLSTVTSPSSHASGTPDPFDLPNGDPNFNPSFLNDTIAPQRGRFENAMHFWQKHCGDLFNATKSYLTSHFEFGGCLLDYDGLKKRYSEIRKLEDINEVPRRPESNGKLLRRVRFVNYYSASTGRIKNKRSKPANEIEMNDLSMRSSDPASDRSTTSSSRENNPSPRLSLEENVDGRLVQRALEDVFEAQQQAETPLQEYKTIGNEVYNSSAADPAENQAQNVMETIYKDLPPIPPEPQQPLDLEPGKYFEKDALKFAQKEHRRQVKAYERAKKDRESTIRDREKIIKKRQKNTAKQGSKVVQQQKQQTDTDAKSNPLKEASVTVNSEARQHNEEQEEADRPNEIKKDRKFCSLPPKSPKTGLRDATWVRVLMEGFDEVTAHTSLFFVSETYAKLVGDAATRIQDWVQDDQSTKQAMSQDFDLD